jgi:hypothetical protein
MPQVAFLKPPKCPGFGALNRNWGVLFADWQLILLFAQYRILFAIAGASHL